MITFNEFKKVEMRIDEVDGEKVMVVFDNKNKAVLVVGGILIVPDGDIEVGTRVS